MAKPYTGPAPILVGFDASDDAVRALEYAARLAARTKTMLEIVYVADDTVTSSAWGVVYDPDQVRATAKEFLADAVATARAQGAAKKRIRTQVALGTPVGVLTQLSDKCQLVIVGRSANSGSDKQFAGSTAVGLAATARCPLMVVAEQPERASGLPIGVAIDSSGKGEAALAWALANRGSAPVKVISVCRAPTGLFRSRVSPEHTEQVMTATRERVTHLVARETPAEHMRSVTTEVLYGSPVDELVARSGGLAKLVVEAHPSFPTYTVGGTVRGILAHAQCPVVIVR